MLERPLRASRNCENKGALAQIALDASQRPSYLLYCIQRWIGLVLDLIVAGIAARMLERPLRASRNCENKGALASMSSRRI
jgi:hypothetical protein